MTEVLKKFKLDNKVFDNFDDLMSKHLDSVEELTISNIQNNSKYFCIFPICFI